MRRVHRAGMDWDLQGPVSAGALQSVTAWLAHGRDWHRRIRKKIGWSSGSDGWEEVQVGVGRVYLRITSGEGVGEESR